MPPFSLEDRHGHHNGWHCEDRNSSGSNNSKDTNTESSSTENNHRDESLVESAADDTTVGSRDGRVLLVGPLEDDGSTTRSSRESGIPQHECSDTYDDEDYGYYCCETTDNGGRWHNGCDDRDDDCGFGNTEASIRRSASPRPQTPWHHHEPPAKELHAISERRVVFAPGPPTVVPIDNRKRYTAEERRKMWYTPGELSDFRKRSAEIALAISKDPALVELYRQCPLHFRGLEHLIDHAFHHHHHHHEGTTTTTTTEGMPPRSSVTRHWNAVRAVLDEQDLLRFRYYQQQCYYYYHYHYYHHDCHHDDDRNQGVVDGARGETDVDERLRSVYIEEGETEESSAMARNQALLDESHALEIRWEEDDRRNHHHHYTRDDDGHYHNYNNYYYHDDDGDGDHEPEEGPGGEFSRRSEGVRGVLRKLLVPVLDPFLEIREGNISVDIGEFLCRDCR